ncbi:hypothetical protein SNOG_05085 [Parastagonospora nodorum SN15]|uniref:Uncharacterized protein n=1 Tax=Phaeosphaeria nodorum (strain SN15 / ATCC MYA-4574 / FGSC 10173) TaxID=321614 RepID=Q0UT29_PHANO|nr:hypothetical protein SNOG_05085 [Parastagonospora nodorum SN15]EAT87476.2 hypothetical protein SNOG_05085 [Parastagonospora nodorum SN15]
MQPEKDGDWAYFKELAEAERLNQIPTINCSKDAAVSKVMVISHLEANAIQGTRFRLDVACQRIAFVLFINVAIFLKCSPAAKDLDLKARTVWKEYH